MDFSFLKLNTDFQDSKFDRMIESDRFYNGGVCLHPEEKYLQITNSKVNIAFDDSYKVEIIDCNETVLLDITDKVYIVEFQDNNGIYQIAYEIAPINQDFYYQKVFLKFTHLDSTLRLYSTDFILTSEAEKTSLRFDYKSYGVYNGTNYVLADFYQSIRISGYYDLVTGKEDSKVYQEINGNIRKSRIIQSFENNYKIDRINSFVYARLFNALNNEVLYINGEKATVTDDLTSSERIGKTNIFPAEFKAQINEDETFIDTYQIASQLEIIQLTPLGNYTLVSIPTTGVADFNSVISYGSGYLRLYDYDTDVLLNTIAININSTDFDFTMPILPVGNYYFNFDDGLIFNNLGLTTNISDKETWKFSILAGQYNKTQYNNSQYFTD